MFSQDTIDGVMAFAVIDGLCKAGASGVLTCAADGFEKRIRFWKGRVTLADSTLIDDRMGEIIYRKGMLTLDEFVEAAGKVSKDVRFGEALICSGVFEPLDLWDALVTQTREIIASLCFYPTLEISFKKEATFPRVEYPVHDDLDEIFAVALAERDIVNAFVRRMEDDSRLVLEDDAHILATNDFRKDMAGLLEKSGDFNILVQNDSRLSNVYSVRAVVEIFSCGVIKDTLHFWSEFVSDGVSKAIRDEIEGANFMFAELLAAAANEGVSDWSSIVGSADAGLVRRFGGGTFLHPEAGFLLSSVMRSLVCESSFYRRVGERPVRDPRWLDASPRLVREALLSTILQIHFELLNRNISSPEFMRAKEVICELRK